MRVQKDRTLSNAQIAIPRWIGEAMRVGEEASASGLMDKLLSEKEELRTLLHTVMVVKDAFDGRQSEWSYRGHTITVRPALESKENTRARKSIDELFCYLMTHVTGSALSISRKDEITPKLEALKEVWVSLTVESPSGKCSNHKTSPFSALLDLAKPDSRVYAEDIFRAYLQTCGIPLER